MFENKEYEIFSVQSVYEIPPYYLKSKEIVYEFYEDATLGISEAYQYAKSHLPELPPITFTTPPIETFGKEIGGVLYLLTSRN